MIPSVKTDYREPYSFITPQFNNTTLIIPAHHCENSPKYPSKQWMAPLTRLRTTMRTIIMEELMMVDLRSDQPTKMTPKIILVSSEADLQQMNSTSECTWFSKAQRSWLHNVSQSNNGQKQQMKEVVWTQRPSECQKWGLEHLFAVFTTASCMFSWANEWFHPFKTGPGGAVSFWNFQQE